MVSQSQTLFEQKKNCLEEILNRLINWDQSADSAQMVIDQNQESIEKIVTIDNELSSDFLTEFTEKNRWLIEQVIAHQKSVISAISRESVLLAEQMKQVNQRDKVVSHYIDKEESMFVDRDM